MFHDMKNDIFGLYFTWTGWIIQSLIVSKCKGREALQGGNHFPQIRCRPRNKWITME